MDIQGRTQYELALKAGKSKVEALKIGNEHNRDKSRSPMQWNNQSFAGFSDKSSWIKVNPNYTNLNVVNLDKNENSILNKYKKLIALRNSQLALQYGSYTNLSFSNDCIRFERTFKGEHIKCYFNFGKQPLEIKLNSKETILAGENKMEPDSYLLVKQ
ncbi:hypothetical protein AB3G34_09120 [Flavobacterium sp. WC2409]